MREALERVFAEYGAAREQIFAGHELANYIRGPMAGEMRARRSWILLFPSLAILLTGAIAASAQPKILFVGDSITAGGGATDPPEGGFVAQIDDRFPELIAANAGCGGSTVRDWTTDFGRLGCPLGNAWNLLAVPDLPAQITHVMLGINDALGFSEPAPVSPAEYEIRLRVLIERAPGLVLISTPPVNPNRPSGVEDGRLRGYREAIGILVAESAYVEHGVDSYRLLDPAMDFANGDIHPNDRGHTRIADELERRILQLLPRGFLSPCRNEIACRRFSFIPRYRHPKGRSDE